VAYFRFVFSPFVVLLSVQGTHMHVAPWPHFQDIRLVARDMHGNELRYRVVNKPEWGTVTKASGDANKFSCLFRYTPYRGHSGFDFFTFVASNAVMDSNLATVSLKVDATLVPLPPVHRGGLLAPRQSNGTREGGSSAVGHGAEEAKSGGAGEPPEAKREAADLLGALKAFPKSALPSKALRQPDPGSRQLVKMLSLVGEEVGVDADSDGEGGEGGAVRRRTRSSDEGAAAPPTPAPRAAAAAPTLAPTSAPMASGAAAHLAVIAVAGALKVESAAPPATSSPLPAVPLPPSPPPPPTCIESADNSSGTAGNGLPVHPTSAAAPTTPLAVGPHGPPVPPPPASNAAAAASVVDLGLECDSSSADDDDDDDDVRLTMDLTNTNSMGFGSRDSEG
jgi:hypothetical protein